MLSGINVIRDNNFTRNVEDFVSEVRTIGKTYIYHYNIYKDHGRKLRLELIGEPLSHEDSLQLFSKAESFKIKEKQLVIGQQAIGMTGSELQNEIEGVYQSIDVQMMSRDAQIQELRSRVNKLDSLLKVLSDTTAKAPVKQ